MSGSQSSPISFPDPDQLPIGLAAFKLVRSLLECFTRLCLIENVTLRGGGPR